MKKFICQVILGLAFIYGCEQKQAQEIKLVSKEEFIQLVDTISIAIKHDLLGDYYYWTISEDDYYVAYHHMLHRIDVFDLNNLTFSHSIPLEKRGPDGVPSTMYVLKTGDEYVLSNAQYYYRITNDGSIVSKAAISKFSASKDGFLFYQKRLASRNYDDLSIDKDRNYIYRPIYKYDDKRIDYSSFFMCYIDYMNWTSDVIKVTYPESYVKTYTETSFLGDGCMLRNGHSMVFNFPGSNEIYVFDTVLQNTKVYDPFISNKEEMQIGYNENMGIRYHPRFLSVKYNAKSNSYYRLHKTQAKGENFSETDYFLINMDSNFNTIVQYNLGDLFNPRYRIHKGYLYFTAKDVDKDALYNLKLYRIKG